MLQDLWKSISIKSTYKVERIDLPLCCIDPLPLLAESPLVRLLLMLVPLLCLLLVEVQLLLLVLISSL